jgi:hypothetical protein
MAGRDEESQAIMSAAMQYVKTGDRSTLESFSLAALKKADYQLSDRDNSSGYRRAIKDLITEREPSNETANQDDVIDVKPNFFGLGINLNESWRRVRKLWSKK